MSETDLKDTLAALSEATTQGLLKNPDCTEECLIKARNYVLSGDYRMAYLAMCEAFGKCRSGQLVPVPSVDGWIVGNGSETKWRTWKDGWSGWTDDPLEATRYARREDAEAVHAEDDDAWTVQPATAVIAAMKGEGLGDA